MTPLPSGLLAFDALGSLPGLRHGVTTRAGGVSTGPWATMNLSLRTGDDGRAVRENRRRAASAILADPERLVIPEQCHGARVAIVGAADAGRGAYADAGGVAGVDGLVTVDTDVALLALSADCVLLLLYDPERRALGVAHASWRGTVGEIGPAAVAEMTARFGCAPDALWAGISPAIGPCCYEVGPDLLETLARERPYALDFVERGPGRPRLNLWDLNWHQLVAAGVRADQIEVARLCTRCRPDLFYSWRRDGPATGRFGLVAAISP